MAILDRSTRLRMRRIFRRRRRQVEAATQQAEQQFDTNLIGRFDRLVAVRRFATGWLLLAMLIIVCTILQTMSLSGYYQTLQPVAGGIYNEGIVGAYSNASPLYATGAVDTSVSRLVFSGLLKYDSQNHLTGDLASTYSVDSTGKHYTVTLRPNLQWQDGKQLTAADVAFTYHLLQNPDVGSPFLASWQGIDVSAKDARTIVFTLPNVLSSFPYSLTNGIVPEHILSSVPVEQLRTNAFNSSRPVGSGPFAWKALQLPTTTDPAKAITLVALQPFDHYAAGKPKLAGFVIRAYPDEQQMLDAYTHRDINAMSGLSNVPKTLATSSSNEIYNFPSTAALMTFFKTSSGVLTDAQVRQALIQGANTQAIIKQLGYSARPVHEPLLIGQLGYDSKYKQAGFDRTAANTILEKAGWVRGKNGIRSKAGQQLTFRIYAQDTAENRQVINDLTADWRAIGVDASSILQPLSDFQTTLEFHTYDALLYGISIGADPDVFAYWDSSQADVRANPRLNFSEYNSTTADAALESGRTRTDPSLRAIKYRPFLQAWQTDAPALGLYQPRLLYVTRGTVSGLTEHVLNTDADRYNSVANWEIHTARVTNK